MFCRRHESAHKLGGTDFMRKLIRRHSVKPFVVRRTTEQLPSGGHGSPNGSSAVMMWATSIKARAPRLCSRSAADSHAISVSESGGECGRCRLLFGSCVA